MCTVERCPSCSVNYSKMSARSAEEIDFRCLSERGAVVW